VALAVALSLRAQDTGRGTQLPNGKLLGTIPGNPRQINNLPTAAAISPDGRFVVFLHSGYGAYTSGEKQSLSVLNLATDELKNFPDDRLSSDAKQTYFLGLAFSLDGKHLFASMASLTDPLGKQKGSTGNGIAVYGFDDGCVTPERFLPLPPRLKIPNGKKRHAEFRNVTYPAGLSIAESGGQERCRQSFRRSASFEHGGRQNRTTLRSLHVQAESRVSAVHDGDDQRWRARLRLSVERFDGGGAQSRQRPCTADDSAAQADLFGGRRLASHRAASERRQLAPVRGAH
jgi:hypothetical protein